MTRWRDGRRVLTRPETNRIFIQLLFYDTNYHNNNNSKWQTRIIFSWLIIWISPFTLWLSKDCRFCSTRYSKQRAIFLSGNSSGFSCYLRESRCRQQLFSPQALIRLSQRTFSRQLHRQSDHESSKNSPGSPASSRRQRRTSARQPARWWGTHTRGRSPDSTGGCDLRNIVLSANQEASYNT